ncbi:MAG: DUF2007 domain-containing protein [Deltaproteobacteria bacterium]|mgnify:FL=1|jgi:hypothetical protein|nr:DUF2007 domain-containing protein [Deltaproteobacteria bacterium]
MNPRIFLSFILTVISMFFLYQFDKRSTWNHSYYIISIFIIFWIFSQINLQIDRYKDDSKIVDLNHYRKQKQKRKVSKSPRKLQQYDKTVTLFSSCEKTKIELIRSLLTSNAIECFIENQHMASIYPSIEGINMEIKVRSQDLDSALQILKQHNMIS